MPPQSDATTLVGKDQHYNVMKIQQKYICGVMHNGIIKKKLIFFFFCLSVPAASRDVLFYFFFFVCFALSTLHFLVHHPYLLQLSF